MGFQVFIGTLLATVVSISPAASQRQYYHDFFIEESSVHVLIRIKMETDMAAVILVGATFSLQDLSSKTHIPLVFNKDFWAVRKNVLQTGKRDEAGPYTQEIQLKFEVMLPGPGDYQLVFEHPNINWLDSGVLESTAIVWTPQPLWPTSVSTVSAD